MSEHNVSGYFKTRTGKRVIFYALICALPVLQFCIFTFYINFNSIKMAFETYVYKTDGTDGIVINPGAFTHYSYAIHDALASITIPKVEIHISDITKREEFRKISVTAPACGKQIYGHGLDGYLEAIDAVLDMKK